ncbi:nucleotidyltransferase family protein [Shimia sp.]|uniref:nucleotidyltransferase family protein n=1 Tax=Shimia sp. TaxID=1954381 RepID=UPI003297A4BF
MCEIKPIMLAAGLSSRIGERNKLLLPIHGVPMIQHMVATYRVVVTGHEVDAVKACLDRSVVQVVHNPNYSDGQQSSVACGLRAVEQAVQILIGLSDQPTLTSSDLQMLSKAHKAGDAVRISIPQLDGQRGNPILVLGTPRDRLLADPRSPRRKFIRANPDHVQFHALTSCGFYADVDTPEAYDAATVDNTEKTI